MLHGLRESQSDRADWPKLLKIRKDIGVDWRDRKLIAALYMGQRAVVRLKHGLRQGCTLSPILSNIYAEAMIRVALWDVDEGICVGGHLIKSVRFADDQASIAC